MGSGKGNIRRLNISSENVIDISISDIRKMLRSNNITNVICDFDNLPILQANESMSEYYLQGNKPTYIPEDFNYMFTELFIDILLSENLEMNNPRFSIPPLVSSQIKQALSTIDANNIEVVLSEVVPHGMHFYLFYNKRQIAKANFGASFDTLSKSVSKLNTKVLLPVVLLLKDMLIK